MKELSQYYGQLNPMERLGATVHALARGDTLELDRLIDTCPKKSYRTSDLAYHIRLAKLMTLVLLVKVEILDTSNKAMALLSVLLALESDEDEDANRESIVEDTYLRLIAMLKGKLSAWDDFCHSLGFEGDEVMQAFHLKMDDDLLLELAELGLGRAAYVEPDNSAQQRLLSDLRDMWATVEAKVD